MLEIEKKEKKTNKTHYLSSCTQATHSHAYTKLHLLYTRVMSFFLKKIHVIKLNVYFKYIHPLEKKQKIIMEMN